MTPPGQSVTNRVAATQRAYKAGERGYYVCNRRTGIAVAGPFYQEAKAVQEAQRRDREVPSPDPFEVRQVNPW